jgi:2-polyprenyl-3-methyl-5-hydroxy-6-metoxy-1,4-benzoquinol methylase
MMTENGDDNSAHLHPPQPTVHLASLATRRAASTQRRVWSRRVNSWDQHGSHNLGAVTAALVSAADVQPGADVLDLGCGNGQISIPLATSGANVLAIDVSAAMTSKLEAEAGRRALPSLTALAVPIEELEFPPASFDFIVSSYALHHLRDADKARLVRSAYGWLRPGGRFIVADMMFGRGASQRDRAIIRSKLSVFARKGPGGWWRIAKNAARYLIRVQERPISMTAWTALLEDAGFTSITASTIVAEAGLVAGARPGPSDRRVSAAATGTAWSDPR